MFKIKHLHRNLLNIIERIFFLKRGGGGSAKKEWVVVNILWTRVVATDVIIIKK